MWDEGKARKLGEPYDFQIFSESSEKKTNQELSNPIKRVYQEGRKKDPEVFKDDIHLTPEKLRTVVGYLESINLGDSDRSIHPSIKQVFLNLTLHLESSRKS
ncbi:hypothetical protein KBT16_10620 [Nostoc sp. CCCryo 231-06]|nr:hypothetical protein [Nostoc sp. CCCryo 231-06]